MEHVKWLRCTVLLDKVNITDVREAVGIKETQPYIRAISKLTNLARMLIIIQAKQYCIFPKGAIVLLMKH